VYKPAFPRTIVLCGAALILSGCAAMDDLFPAQRGSEAALAERPRLPPIERNVFALHSAEQSVVGMPQVVFANDGDTLSLLSREYGLGFDELVAANPDIDPWLPEPGAPILLPTQYILPDAPRTGIVLNIAAKRLFYYPPADENGRRVVMTYPIGIGRVGWETPLGAASVVSKARDPHWWVPASVRQEHAELGDPLPAVVPPGADNPLGRFVLKLDMPGYLIHGTNQPYGVGMRVSHGCVRLYPENIESLYPLIDVGVDVAIVNQPYLAGWSNGDFFFEAHLPLEDDLIDAEAHLRHVIDSLPARLNEASTATAAETVRAVAAAASGLPVRISAAGEDNVYERVRIVHNTITPDPDVPTLAEVRALLDEPLPDMEEADTTNGSSAAESESAANDDASEQPPNE